MKGGTFKIFTLGCKVNQYESAYVEESLVRAGWRRAEKGDRADAVLVNTCMVTGQASCQSRQAIRKHIRENPGGVVVATGCYAQVRPQELAAIPGIHLVVGNTFKGRLPQMIQRAQPLCPPAVMREDFPHRPLFEYLPVHTHPGHTRAFLKIQDGCNAYCSYCIVPYGRGGPRSMNAADLVDALKGFAREGYSETVLTGIHLGKYGEDLSPRIDLKTLLRHIGREGPPLRVRLSSLEPNEIDREIVDMMAAEPWLCRHVHLPLQSGDDRILKRMNRRYTARAFEEVVTGIRERIPHAAIGADVLVGFPGESEEAFGNTRDLIDRLPLTHLHVFPFSPRPGTPAAGFPDPVPLTVIRRRAASLRELGNRKRRAFFRSCLGGIYPVIVEDPGSGEGAMARGLADNYLPVSFPATGDSTGVIRVHAETVDGDNVIGRPVG